MTSRHPLHDVYILAASDVEASGLSPEDVKARLLELLPSYEADFDTIINSGGHEWRAEAPNPAQEQAPESSESKPKSFSDQLRDELRERVAQNKVSVPE